MKLIISISLLLSFLSPLLAKEIIIASESWAGATNRDGTGLYWDVVRKVYEPLGYTIVTKHGSYAQTADMVRLGQADIFLGSYLDQKEFALYPKYYFDEDVNIAIFRKDIIEKWKGKQSLKGLRTGWIRGYDYDKYLGIDVNKEEVSSRPNGLKLLKSERLDVFIDDRENVEPYLSKAEIESDEYAKKVILELKIYPAFVKSKFGEKLREEWDKQMKVLIETEEFKELYYESDYTDFPY